MVEDMVKLQPLSTAAAGNIKNGCGGYSGKAKQNYQMI